MKLRELAHARAGDKGNISNISVIAHEPGTTGSSLSMSLLIG
jgi:hypothetical protein